MNTQSLTEWFAHPGHPLSEHLVAVAALARGFAEKFGSGDWGYLAGLWHDLGKYQPEFQRRLRGEQVSVEHSGAGAAHAVGKFQGAALPLAFVIAGHHSGLANLRRSEPGAPSPLMERLSSNEELAKRLRDVVPESILGSPPLTPPMFLESTKDMGDRMRRAEFWTRFVFSALTDADYLDTEKALDPVRAKGRTATRGIDELLLMLEAAIAEKQREAAASILQLARAGVVDACRQAAELPRGMFSLTAPTGAGKTLASMLFALRHAKIHGMDRVMVVLPYTSIIEQNAEVYREVFGEEIVLEHHSNLDPEVEASRKGDELTAKHRLASENWDAPIVVTTTVQFFESLFSNRSSRCRKLHNIARSVVILDEVQSLPPDFLITILFALTQLSTHYGCSIVLSTATPPALVARPNFEWGLANVREIIPERAMLARQLRRVKYQWPSGSAPVQWEELAQSVVEHPSALVVVHLRNDARLLAEMIQTLRPDEAVYHLSALMCAAHRSDVLKRVRAHLSNGEPCRLVSTQLIEAGVDIDFPVLFRAMAGLDSIVQAAGRCNREGRLETGTVHIFHAPSQPPAGVLRQGLNTMGTLLAAKGGDLNPADPETCLEYFRLFYGLSVRDARGIEAERKELNFSTVAEKFRLIEDQCTSTVVVPFGDSKQRLDKLAEPWQKRDALRGLQRFTVHVYPVALRRLLAAGAVDEVFPGVYGLIPPFHNLYSTEFGLTLSGDLFPEPERLII